MEFIFVFANLQDTRAASGLEGWREKKSVDGVSVGGEMRLSKQKAVSKALNGTEEINKALRVKFTTKTR